MLLADFLGLSGSYTQVVVCYILLGAIALAVIMICLLLFLFARKKEDVREEEQREEPLLSASYAAAASQPEPVFIQSASQSYTKQPELIYYEVEEEAFEPVHEILFVAEREEAPVVEEPTPVEEEPIVEEAQEPVTEVSEVAQADEEESVAILEQGDDEDDDAPEVQVVGNKKITTYRDWSFHAKLLNATPEMKERYCEIMDELASYRKVKAVESWKKVRVYSGRVNYAMLVFKGKTLCVAFALNPADYVDTTYIYEYIGDVKKFEETPMLMRMTSGLQVRRAKELFQTLFKDFKKDEVRHEERHLPYKSKGQLLNINLIKTRTSETTIFG